MASWMAGIFEKVLTGIGGLHRSNPNSSTRFSIGAAVVTVGVGIWIVRRRRAAQENAKSEGPLLITLGYSHYCELARWALDKPPSGVAIPYREVSYPVGVHGRYVPKYRKGLEGRNTMVPVFVSADGTVYGSSAEIVEYAGWKFSDAAFKALTVDVLGPASRRLTYYHTLRVTPAMIRDVNVAVSESRLHAVLLWVYWYWLDLPSKIMHHLQLDGDYTPAADMALIDGIFEQVEQRLAADGGVQYLGAGGEFGAEDLAFASMAAPALWPDDMSFCGGLFHRYPLDEMPGEFVAAASRWRETVAGRHVIRMFEMHRS